MLQDNAIIGRELGNFVIESKLGEGGMGAVYRMVHRSLPNTYAALKLLNARGAAVASAKERFEQEAKVAAALGSDRVVKPLDIGEFSDGTPYFIMEYVAGQSLADLLDQTGPMRVLPALDIAYAVADTLVHAHGIGIIHRDIKPSNIMLVRSREQEFKVKILDWGIARARGTLQVAQTESYAIAGTLGYMSPEAVRGGEAVDGRADVFSLGVMLYKTLTGVLPFPALTSEDQIPAFLAARPMPIAQHRSPSLDTVPRWLERLVFKALTPLRERRPTMDQFRTELGHALSGVRASPENAPLTPPAGLRADDDLSESSRETSNTNAAATVDLSASTALVGSNRATGTTTPASSRPRKRLLGGLALAMGLLGLLSLWAFVGRSDQGAIAPNKPHAPRDLGRHDPPDLSVSRPKLVDMGSQVPSLSPPPPSPPPPAKPPKGPGPGKVRLPVETNRARIPILKLGK